MTPQNNLTTNDVFDRELHEIYCRLGEVVLVPFSDEDKLLAHPKSFAETQTEKYLRQLFECHVAVMLGPSSGDLYAVSFGTAESAREFLRDNPIAGKTVTVNDFGHVSYFFRIEGFVPPAAAWACGKWLGAGQCVPLRTKGRSFVHVLRIANASPAKVAFEDLTWPVDVQRRFTPSIVEARYGKPFFLGRSGRRDLNYSYWAYFFAYENHVRYSDAMEEFFYFDTNATVWKALPRSVLEHTLLNFLVALARQPGFEPLQCRVGSGDRKKLIAEMKIVALCQFPELVDNVHEFVAECIEAHGGSNVTIAELHSAYAQFCNSRRKSKLSEREFQNRLTDVIESSYCIRRSHSIQRNGGNVRGFRNLRLKLSIYQVSGELFESDEKRSSMNGTA